jgi:hypothetical protein
MCLLVFAVAAGVSACKTPPTPTQVQDVTSVANDTCTLIEAITDDGTVRTICATVDEIGVIANVIEAGRVDARRELARCGAKRRPGNRRAALTRHAAIDAVNARRAAALRRDGGAS